MLAVATIRDPIVVSRHGLQAEGARDAAGGVTRRDAQGDGAHGRAGRLTFRFPGVERCVPDLVTARATNGALASIRVFVRECPPPPPRDLVTSRASPAPRASRRNGSAVRLRHPVVVERLVEDALLDAGFARDLA